MFSRTLKAKTALTSPFNRFNHAENLPSVKIILTNPSFVFMKGRRESSHFNFLLRTLLWPYMSLRVKSVFAMTFRALCDLLPTSLSLSDIVSITFFLFQPQWLPVMFLGSQVHLCFALSSIPSSWNILPPDSYMSSPSALSSLS